MSTSYWMVPTNLDALFLPQDQGVPGPMADFSLQPWTDGTQDYNSSTPFTSEQILARPFEDSSFRLKAGIHLHWSLPDSLTRILVDNDGSAEYPPVPDRWLISRTGGNLPAQQWIVESTYLSDDTAGAITMPLEPAANEAPFTYMGRTMQLSSWSAGATSDYAASITAIGYGEPTFAAFYPNCHSVFGFYDGEVETAEEGLAYTVVGYYANPSTDYFANFLSEYLQDNPGADTQQQLEAIEEFFNWTTSDDVSNGLPALMMCYSTITFAPGGTSPDLQSLASQAGITIGQTGMEALSARLAYMIDPAYKNMIEDQLEAVQLLDYLGSRQVDLGAAFLEARHGNGFNSLPAGTLWTITRSISNMQTADAQQSQEADEIPLPGNFSDLLNLLNLLQQRYDAAWLSILSKQQQLFADWYKYQTTAHPPQDLLQSYPPPSQIRWFIESQSLPAISALAAQTGMITYAFDSNGNINGAATTDAPGTLAWQLVSAVNNLTAQIAAYNATPEMTNTSATFTLNGGAAPRYWFPRDPVVLVTGDIAIATDRHGMDGADGPLPCHITTLQDDVIVSTGGVNSIDPELLTAISGWTGEPNGFNTWTAQPWNPFMLEWLVEMQPLQSGSNIGNTSRTYSEDFITSNYELPENSADLVPAELSSMTVTASLFYSGRSILSTGPGDFLLDRILQSLYQNVMPAYFAAEDIKPDPAYLDTQSNVELVISWYETTWFTSETTDEEKAADPDFTMLRAWSDIFGLNFLSQSLDGFTNGLLQLKSTLQLPVADPTGFPNDQAFAQALATIIGDQNTRAPLPLNSFSPVRSGNLVIRALRIIDTFGQVADLSTNTLLTSEPLAPPPGTGPAWLAPRLAQPARLNLRWLSAKNDTEEMNDVPASNPVCGWIIPNLFDRSLAFFSSEGGALGSLDYDARWVPAPGSADAVYYLPNIPDRHLHKVITWLMARGKDFFGSFLEAVENGVENIQPEGAAQHGSMGLIAGQPLAVVRARVSLSQAGDPAISQSWLSLRQDLRRNYRDTAMTEYVNFPVRLGEYEQLNDGLIGYWIEEHGKFEDDLFYAPQSGDVDDPGIITHGESTFTIDIAPADQPVTLTMLFDPRGKLHATSGILPVKAIDIPATQYTSALQKMEISFLTAPLVTDGAQLFIPQPEIPGYSWSWVQLQNSSWTTTSDIKPVRGTATFSETQVVLEGWMKLAPGIQTISDDTTNP